MYPRLLNRPADTQDEQHWVAFVQARGTFEQVAAALVNSQEYYVRRGGTDLSFVIGLYADVLSRGNATTADLAYWETAFDSGASRASVAIAFLSFQEYRKDLVQNDYTTFLLRAADPGGLANWVNALNAAFTDQEVLAEILGSPEAYQHWSLTGGTFCECRLPRAAVAGHEIRSGPTRPLNCAAAAQILLLE